MSYHPLPVTLVIATKNEALNIRKCLESARGFQKTLIVDSHSQDDTASIASEYGAEVVQFTYQGGYPKKRQWALENLKINTPWVMLLDADEELTQDLSAEIECNLTCSDHCGFLIKKGFHFLGRKFKFGGFSHAAVLLFRVGKARFEHLIDEPPTAPDMEIHERLIVDGSVGKLKTPSFTMTLRGCRLILLATTIIQASPISASTTR